MALHEILLDAAAGEYRDLAEPARIQDAPHLERVVRQIAAVQAHAAQLDALGGQLPRSLMPSAASLGASATTFAAPASVS
jgi:hypothetical protein